MGFSEHQSKAVVKAVDRVIDAASHTFQISLEMSTPDYRLPAGVRCSVRFNPSE